MTFELVRWGWPNAAAILALAAMPIWASIAEHQQAVTSARTEPATICLAPAECGVLAAAASPEIAFE